MNSQATIRLEEGCPLFIALFQECKKITNEEVFETDLEGNLIIRTPLELGGKVIAELEIHSDSKKEWITLFLG